MTCLPDPYVKTGAPTPASHSLSASFQSYRSQSQEEHRSKSLKYLAKSNADFREMSRREDANLVRTAFNGPTQDSIAQKGSRAIGVSPRQIINWMKMEHDMPSWAVKAVKNYLRAIDATAQRIEGKNE